MESRTAKPDGAERSLSYGMRSPSMSSDVMSTSTKSVGTATSVPSANPLPAYVAQDEASKLISTELERAVVLSPTALTMVNEFLDHVLYSIIYTSHSMSLSQLKAAVPSVLKPRLGKAALRVAEEELKEYLEEEEEAEMNSKKPVFQPELDFDTELVWKVARLRCMVYARLGDLEEEDEEDWLDREQLLEQVGEAQKRSKQSLEVGPGAAIFLSAVIEFLGEQALHYAAQHAQKRHDFAKVAQVTGGEDNVLTHSSEKDVVTVDGKDMNHVGRDSPLSRLWRSWRRNTRSNTDIGSQPQSPDASRTESPKASRSLSSGAPPPIRPIAEELNEGNGSSDHPVSPSQIQLPMSENDVEEIEGRVLPNGIHDSASELTPPERSKKRPTSMFAMPGKYPSYISQQDSPEVPVYSERSSLRPEPTRTRSLSMPTVTTPFNTKPAEPKDQHIASAVKQYETEKEVAELDNAGSVDPSRLEAKEEENRAKNTSQDKGKKNEEELPQQSGLIDGTIAAITGAFGAVGVHHVNRDPPKPRQTSRPSARLTRNLSNDSDPVARASIVGPSDFENMHIPVGQYTPNEIEMTQQERDLANGIVPGISVPSDYITSHDSGHRSSSEIVKIDNRLSQRFSGSSYYAATLPVVNETNNGNNQPKDAAPSPTVRMFTSSPKISTGVFPVRASSLDEHRKPRHAASASRSSEYSHHSKSSSSSSRLLGFTRDGQGRPQTIHQQRAAGEMADDVRAAHSTTPTSRSRSRPQTSDSPTEQRRRHTRTQSESSDYVKSPPLDMDHTKRSFEVLVNSDETLHYTLTPKTAEFPQEQTATPAQKRTATQDLADFFRNTGPPGPETPIKNTRSTKETAKLTPVSVPVTTVVERKPESISATPTSERPRVKVGEPRDPQIRSTASTRDLADYARSTGPTDDTQLPKALSGNVRAANGNVVKPSAASVISEPSIKSPTPTPKKPQNRLKFQARDARPARSAETSDLIDFIREGPPRQQGEHRIDRHVAPFRTTMDSDDLNALAPKTDEQGNIRVSDSSTQDTSVARSAETSVNSQTALLNKATANGVGIAISTPSRQPPINEGEEGMPKRTRRRVKDPYAIDDSDEDEVDENLVNSLKHDEESLIDFLRNTAPTPGMTAQPILSAPPESANTAAQHSPSGGRIKEVLRTGRSSTPTSDERLDPPRKSARAESPHLTQVGSKYDRYKPTQTTHAAHVDRNRNRSRSSGKETIGKGYGDTADLAEYLRNTGPPAGKEYQPEPFIFSSSPTPNGVTGSAKEDSALKKFFSLKKNLKP